MNVIEGTPTGQVNSSQSAENSVGSAFAELNLPMSAKALTVSLAEVPRPWHPAAMQTTATVPVVSGADLMADLTGESVPQLIGEPVQLWRDMPVCGLITIVNESWILGASPRTIRTVCRRFGIPTKRGRVDAAIWIARLTGNV